MHDLRHTFATTLRKAGYGIDVIAQLLGHADLRQTQIYAHIADETLNDAVASVQGQFVSTKIH
jgi:site-specific recombinase XerD